MKLFKSPGRRAAIPAALLAVSLGACDSVLDVENPGAVLDEQLSDSTNTSLLASTVVSDFQYIYDDVIRNLGWFGDEMVSGHNFVGYRELDGRIMAGAISFKDAVEVDAALGLKALGNRPEPDRVEQVAARIAAMVRLRQTPPAERRLAILLPDYPSAPGRTG